MSGKDLLLEIGCEEIPSRFMSGALEQLKEKGKEMLEDYRLQYDDIQTYGTPRRLVLLVKNLSLRQEQIKDKQKGPSCAHAYDKDGNPTKAALGFARSAGVEVEELQIEEIKGTEYVVAVRETPGEATEKLLPEIMLSILRSLRFPRSMFWTRKDVRFVRPIRWILCLLGEDTIPFEFADVFSSDNTFGHRFLSPGPWEINDPEHYFEQIKNSYVLLDHHERKELIKKMLINAAKESQGKPLIKEELLEEVTFLVEYPVVIKGEFSRDYLELPKEVLITTMEVHQRYFPVVSASDEILPFFLGVSNNLYNEQTRKGYQKVLQARLEDASFFYREDRKKPLEQYVPRLKEMLFQEELGTLYDKMCRTKELVRRWCAYWNLSSEEITRATRAAKLCKADLLTNMVYEFPELQGVMGREYAKLSGEDKRVAKAILEHYYPRYAGDSLPETIEGVILSLADKMDTLAGCFFAGIQPTGSQDPYGLRRQAQGIVSILLEKKVPLSLSSIIEDALKLFWEEELEEKKKTAAGIEILENLEEFMEQRIRHIFQERDLSYDVVEAVLAVSFETVSSLYSKARVLEETLRNGEVEEVLSGYTRVNNLARKAPSSVEVDPGLFRETAEKQLWEKLQITRKHTAEALKNEDYWQALYYLGGIKPSIDRFFDEVMVMTDEVNLRNNRLGLLLEVKNLFNLYGEFSLIQSSGGN